MNLRFLILSIFMGFLCVELQAGVVITTSDQQTIEALVLDVESLSWEGNFKDGNLVVNYTDGTARQIAISSVESIIFTEDTQDAISQAKAEDSGVCIYDIQGRLVLQSVKSDALNALPKGEYIIKSKDVTIKYLKK